MFKALKEKLFGWLKTSKTKVFESAQKLEVSDKTEKKAEIARAKEEKTEEEKKKSREEKAAEKKTKKEKIEEKEKEEQEKTGFFRKIFGFRFKLDEEYFDSIFSDLELIMLENNVALQVVEKIKKDLKKELLGLEMKKDEVQEKIKQALKISIETLIEKPFNLMEKIKQAGKEPFVIVFFGINGSGKTTTIAKVANLLKKNNLSCILAASDTFRAASIEQLEKHAEKLDMKVIKSNYGADPASVAFDTIKHAKAHNIQAVLIDTAGRMHTKENLLKEMEKICRVAKPDLKIFVAESITGNDAVEQAKNFNQAVGIDAIILTKADVDEKGGTIISVSYITGKPILFLGTGQNYEDLEVFDRNKIIESLGL